MQTYSTIAIKNKEVYLTINDSGETKWTKNKDLALSFNTDSQAEKFAKRYFKNYRNWEVREIGVEFEKQNKLAQNKTEFKGCTAKQKGTPLIIKRI